jgi:cytoskeletal protein RodZ
MITIGELFKQARSDRRLSLAKLEDQTKIKKDFIMAIEAHDWSSLPDFPVVVGFVKSISQRLNINPGKAVALLRRDYPPKKLPINPKPDVSEGFRWSPRLTFIVGVGIVLTVVFAYLGIQYIKFVSPPSLEVKRPTDGETVTQRKVFILGKTDQDATVKANNQPILVDDSGQFSGEIDIFEGTTEIVIKAQSRSGKETEVRRMIKPELN